MGQGRQSRNREPEGKAERETHVLPVGFIHRCGVIREQGANHGFGWSGCLGHENFLSSGEYCPIKTQNFSHFLSPDLPILGYYPIMTADIDDFDRSILAFLQQDASLTVDALAERVHLSRNACWRRIKALEEAGVITRRVALLDAGRVGCPLSVMVLIRTNDHSPSWQTAFRKAISALPEVIGAHRMSGDLDYVLRVRVSDVAAYDRFYKKLTSRVSVSDISASFVMEDIKDTTALPL